MKKIGILPLARSTFDVPFAQEQLLGMLKQLDKLESEICGVRELLFDTDSTLAAIDSLKSESPDIVMLLQVTFTDASMAVEVANQFEAPLVIWAVPEPRLGGRLRLNAFCGLNLASHALGMARRQFGHLYLSADSSQCAEQLKSIVYADNPAALWVIKGKPVTNDNKSGVEITEKLKGMRVARIGEHPEGFSTCEYDANSALDLTGITIDKLPLDHLFESAEKFDTSKSTALLQQVKKDLNGIDEVDQSQLDKSLKLKLALDSIREQGGYDAFAIRCWPETFTEYGGAVCGPVSMLGEAKVPCACEADVYGAITQLLLQATSNLPVFLVDLVDIDEEDDSAVVWHCGQAPVSMADTNPAATIHTNRRMPLLYEFALKPGRVTFARLSQAQGETQLVIAAGDMLQRDMSYTGTSGVVRFDCGAKQLLSNVIGSGIEHHMGLVYGDYLEELRSVAAALDVPLLEFT